jgi:hypothetical protein
MELLPVKDTTQFYSSSETLLPGFFACLFFNRGTNTVQVNSHTLLPGDYLSVGGNYGIINDTSYYVRFIDTGGTNLLEVLRSDYTTI